MCKIIVPHGMPASGKGEQENQLARLFSSAGKKVALFDMGARLREIAKDQSHLYSAESAEVVYDGAAARWELTAFVWKEFFKTIDEVPDYVILGGTVRMKPEVEHFLDFVSKWNKEVTVDVVVLEVPEEVCRKRIGLRFAQEARADDQSQSSIERRFNVFKTTTTEALNFFKELVPRYSFLRYVTINGNQEPEKVLQDIVFAITTKPLQITIHGDNGASKSTAVTYVAQSTGFTALSSGDYARSLVPDKASIEEVAATADTTEPIIDNFDKLVDQWIANQKDVQRIVMDTRLGFHFIPNSFKVRLCLSPDIAAQRIWKDDIRRSREKAKTVEELRDSLDKRLKDDRRRYKKLYDLDILDLKNYDLALYMVPYEGRKPAVRDAIISAFLRWLV